MAKIIVPHDRTCKQPATAICRNPKCLEKSTDAHFEFQTEQQHVVCPKCGATDSPMVGLKALVHFLYVNPQGPVIGLGGLHYALACEQNRAYLATVTNQEAATGDFASVNCPGCLKAAVDRKLVPLQGWSMQADQPVA